MILIESKSMKNVYQIINPILTVSKIAAVCSVANKGKCEMKLSKVLYSFQVVIVIICILHLGYIPYAVIYIEQVRICRLFLN